uniref:60S ribosomal protein L7a n=1 Tax=Oryctolagus cuniculus TaxID=9986 RepID=A0A5F9DRX0_RABIT
MSLPPLWDTWIEATGQGDIPIKRPPFLQAGINTCSTLVENKKAQLVVTARDVDPTELVVFLLALCLKKWWVLNCIIKGPSLVGHLVPRKTCITVTSMQVNLIDKGARAKYDESHCQWGGNVVSPKSMAHIAKLEKAKATECAMRLR